MMYGVPDLPLSGSTRDESTEVEHTMYNVFNKTICVCYYTNSSSGLLFIMCGYCYYIDPAAVRTCMQTNFTVHGQPPQFLIASAANAPNHWSNEDKTEEYIRSVFFSYIDKKELS